MFKPLNLNKKERLTVKQKTVKRFSGSYWKPLLEERDRVRKAGRRWVQEHSFQHNITPEIKSELKRYFKKPTGPDMPKRFPKESLSDDALSALRRFERQYYSDVHRWGWSFQKWRLNHIRDLICTGDLLNNLRNYMFWTSEGEVMQAIRMGILPQDPNDAKALELLRQSGVVVPTSQAHLETLPRINKVAERLLCVPKNHEPIRKEHWAKQILEERQKADLSTSPTLPVDSKNTAGSRKRKPSVMAADVKELDSRAQTLGISSELMQILMVESRDTKLVDMDHRIHKRRKAEEESWSREGKEEDGEEDREENGEEEDCWEKMV